MMEQKLLDAITALYDEMVDLRRHFHMYPELSFKEVNTPKTIAAYHRDLGLEVREGVGTRGVVATLRGKYPGKTVAIRADFDALPITEENDVPYASTVDGVMHACGHDAHTAIALGMAKAFVSVKDDLHGNVVFIHQHAEEEDPGGAKAMIEDGALEGVDIIFATHMENYLPVHHVSHSPDYILAASDDFFITIKGEGGHGAFPQDATDAVQIGAQLVANLHQLVSRKVDPLKSAVLTVGAFKAGEKANVIPGQATIEGTVRTFDDDVRAALADWVTKVAEHTAAMYGAEVEVDYQFGYPATKNDPDVNALIVKAATALLPEGHVKAMAPNMGAEDFSYFTRQIPGAYFFTGSANEAKGFTYPYHHPKFDIDEQALLNGAKVMAKATLDYLTEAQ